MKVAIYARISTHNHCQNPETQLIPLRNYIKNRGFQLFDEYIDTASGIKEKRPQLSKLMIDAKRRNFDCVLVWKLDRLGRSLKHLISLIEEFEALGIQFISYTEAMDTTLPSGRLLFSIVGAIATFERDLICERVKTGLSRVKAQGKRLGSPTVRYKKDDIFVLSQQGLSSRAIGKKLGISHSTVTRALQNPLKNDSLTVEDH